MRGKLLVSLRQALGQGRPADVVIIGGQRCGTRSLFQYLRGHSGVAAAARNEVHYFDLHHDRGPRWYAAHFSARPGLLRLEASPYYLFHPLVPQRIADELPDARFLVLLRDPASRAYSHYQMMRDKGRETLSFEEALREEDSRLVEIGESASQLFLSCARALCRSARTVVRTLPRERFLVTISEEMFSDGPSSIARVCDFLGLPRDRTAEYAHWNARSYPPLAAEAQRALGDFYEPHNRRLAKLLGRELPW